MAKLLKSPFKLIFVFVVFFVASAVFAIIFATPSFASHDALKAKKLLGKNPVKTAPRFSEKTLSKWQIKASKSSESPSKSIDVHKTESYKQWKGGITTPLDQQRALFLDVKHETNISADDTWKGAAGFQINW